MPTILGVLAWVNPSGDARAAAIVYTLSSHTLSDPTRTTARVPVAAQ